MKLNHTTKLELAGRFKLDIIRPDGTVRKSTGWFDNLVLDTGLNKMGTQGIGSHAQVGSGSTAPVAGNSGMQTYVAGSSSVQETTDYTSPSAPYYGAGTRRFRFNAGVAAGNLSEVGVGWAASGANLFSRALIRDGLGDPTTITVLSDEVLDVTYELRAYAPSADVDSTLPLGTPSVDYAMKIRAAGCASNYWNVSYLFDYGANTGMTCTPFNGVIGTVTQTPTGTSETSRDCAVYAYVNNSLKRTGYILFGLSQANLSGGIGAVLFTQNLKTVGAYQVGFTPKIPKDNTKVLQLNFEVSWARRP